MGTMVDRSAKTAELPGSAPERVAPVLAASGLLGALLASSCLTPFPFPFAFAIAVLSFPSVFGGWAPLPPDCITHV